MAVAFMFFGLIIIVAGYFLSKYSKILFENKDKHSKQITEATNEVELLKAIQNLQKVANDEWGHNEISSKWRATIISEISNKLQDLILDKK
jgi:ABC-type bacteriocin/lantibiotic exporter with double-glycine peptidase domain